MAVKKKQEHEKEPNLERWLVSYADFITLMFAVFVTLYAMSQVDKAKVAKVIASTNEAFGITKSTSAPAFHILQSTSLIPLPNIIAKSSIVSHPPTGESMYKTKQRTKPKSKDLVDEAFKTPDQTPVKKKEIAREKEQKAIEKKALAEIQKQEQLAAAQKVLADLKGKEQRQVAMIKQLEAQMPQVPGARAQKTMPKVTEAQEQKTALKMAETQEQKTTPKVAAPVAANRAEHPHQGKTQNEGVAKTAPAVEGKVRASTREFKEIKKNVIAFFKEKGALDKVNLQITHRGLVISLKDAAFFASGSATVRPDSIPLLDNIAQAIGKYSNSIRIEGYTDNVPIKTAQFPSNWELSTARATNIVHFLIKTHGIPPDRLSAVGFGEYHPIASNSTEAGRQKNRRVDIVVLSGAGEQGEPGSNPQQPGH